MSECIVTPLSGQGAPHDRIERRLLRPAEVRTMTSRYRRRYWQPAVDNKGDKAPTSRIE